METAVPTGPEAGDRLLMDGGLAGIGTVICESWLPLRAPSMRRSTFIAPLPGAAVMATPVQRKKRSVADTMTFAGVVQFKTVAANVVVSGVAPVASHSVEPDAEFSVNFARGYIVPPLAVLRIHKTADTLEPAGITPAAFGLPGAVSNALIAYSPNGRCFKSTLI